MCKRKKQEHQTIFKKIVSKSLIPQNRHPLIKNSLNNVRHSVNNFQNLLRHSLAPIDGNEVCKLGRQGHKFKLSCWHWEYCDINLNIITKDTFNLHRDTINVFIEKLHERGFSRGENCEIKEPTPTIYNRYILQQEIPCSYVIALKLHMNKSHTCKVF